MARAGWWLRLTRQETIEAPIRANGDTCNGITALDTGGDHIGSYYTSTHTSPSSALVGVPWEHPTQSHPTDTLSHSRPIQKLQEHSNLNGPFPQPAPLKPLLLQLESKTPSVNLIIVALRRASLWILFYVRTKLFNRLTTPRQPSSKWSLWQNFWFSLETEMSSWHLWFSGRCRSSEAVLPLLSPAQPNSYTSSKTPSQLIRHRHHPSQPPAQEATQELAVPSLKQLLWWPTGMPAETGGKDPGAEVHKKRMSPIIAHQGTLVKIWSRQ